MSKTVSMLLAAALLAAGSTACTKSDAPAATSSKAEAVTAEMDARHAHEMYVMAINSNNANALLGAVTADVVYLPPNSAAIQGKTAVGAWVKDYFGAYQTTWEKTTKEFIVRGDLAYEWYEYTSTDVPRPDGPAANTPTVTDTGNGINIYRRGEDGVWRVARDAWTTRKKAQ